jgi:hypothetical protein
MAARLYRLLVVLLPLAVAAQIVADVLLLLGVRP